MRNTKKWLSLLLALVLLVSLASCGSDKEQPASGQQSSNASQSTTAAPSAEADKSVSKYANKVTIQYANVAPIEGYDFTAGDPYAKFWSEKFNWKIEVSAFTWENWNELLRVWVNSQDMPDVSVFQYNQSTHGDAVSWAEQGLVKRMPDDWRQRWPNVARVFDKTSLGPMTEKLFGGVYYLPRPRFDVNLPGDPLPNHQLVYIRRDWAEAVGFPIKDGYTTSEIIEFARLVKEKDPGGLGDKLVPIATNSDNSMRMFINHNSTYFDSFYKDKNGKYQWGAASDDTLLGLQLMYKAYSEGLLYPEFYTLKTDQDNDMFRIAGNAAVTYMDGTATGMQVNMVTRFGGSTGLDSTKAVHAATVLGEDGHYHLRDLINYWGALIFSPNIKDEVFERYMDALDYGCTEEGYTIQVAGFEGEDYEMRDGKMVNLNPEGMPLEGSEGKYPSIGGYMIANMKLWDDFMVYSPVVNPFWATRSWDMYMYKVKMGTPESFPKTDWNVFTHDSPSRRQVNYQYKDEYANLVSNAKSADDLKANWSAWVKSQMPLVQPVLDELDAK